MQLLVLVPLALTAFGLVMVYSAQSASAALGNGNPVGSLDRQLVFALIGIALLVFAARTDFRQLRALAPTLVIAALGLCMAVLVVGERINGARRWIGFGPAAFQPSELAKLALVIWCAAYLARRPPPRTLKDLAKPIGTLVGLFCLLILVEPDLGTAITIVTMVGPVRRVRVSGPAPSDQVQGSVRQAARGGHHRAHLRPGRDQPRRRPRACSTDRDSAAVRLVRRLQSRHRPPVGRDPP